MAATAVDEIKSRIDIIDVVSGYVTLQRNGREFKGLCPFHGEKTASFTVSPERQVWYCHGCSQGGDVFAFVQKIENVEFREALQQLAERAGVELSDHPREKGNAARRRRVIELNSKAAAFFEHVLWKTDAGATGRELLLARGVDEEMARRFGVGFSPSGGAGEDALVRFLIDRGSSADEIVEAGLAHARGRSARDRFRARLMFPIRDDRGAVIAFGGRATGDAVPKYLNSPETPAYHKSSALFGIDLAREAMRQRHQALVVEGYFDVIAAHRAGIDHVVASSGTAFTREQARILARYTESITLCFDADLAGMAAASRAVDILAAEGLSAKLVVLPAGVKDPGDLVQQDAAALATVVAEAKPEWDVLLERAIGDFDAGSVDERRKAAERSVALLARIPAASARDLYAQQAASRLGLAATALLADVVRARRGERPKPVITVAAPPPSAQAVVEKAGQVQKPLSPAEEYIAAAVLRKPALVKVVTGPFGLVTTEIEHPQLRAIIEMAKSAGDEEVFPVHALDPDQQGTAARLMLRLLPELDESSDERVTEGLQDAVVRLRESVILSAIARLRASASPDPKELSARIDALARLRKIKRPVA